MSAANPAEAGRKFDRLADHMYEGRALYSEVCEFIDRVDGTLLDVGCGQGHLLAQLQERLGPNARLLGCDVSSEQCMRAQTLVPSADVRVGDASTLASYADASVDVVTMVGVLEYCDDFGAVLRAARRVTRSQGRLVLACTNRRWLRYNARAARLEAGDSLPEPHWFEPEEIVGLLGAAGYKVERIRGLWALARGGAWRPLERRAARVAPGLHRRMKLIGLVCRPV